MKKLLIATMLTSCVAALSTTASADGTVTVYTAVPQNFIDSLVPVFEAQTGTTVEIIKAGSGDLLNRLTAEADNPVADVSLERGWHCHRFNPALFEAYEAAGTDALADGMKPSELWSPFTAVVMAFIVNENKLDGLPIPQAGQN